MKKCGSYDSNGEGEPKYILIPPLKMRLFNNHLRAAVELFTFYVHYVNSRSYVAL